MLWGVFFWIGLKDTKFQVFADSSFYLVRLMFAQPLVHPMGHFQPYVTRFDARRLRLSNQPLELSFNLIEATLEQLNRH